MSIHRLSDDDRPHDRRSRSPPRHHESRQRDSHVHEGRHGSMVRGEDRTTRWQRRSSPDYGRGREAERGGARLTPERLVDSYARDNGWGHRNGGDNNGGAANGYGGRNTNYSVGGRDDFFEQRRKERQASNVTFWPPSPRAPYESDDDRYRSSKKSKKHHSSRRSKHRHESSQSESDSESDLRHKKKHKSSRRKSRRDRDKERRQSRHRRSRSPEREHKRPRSRSRSISQTPPDEADADAWVEREPTKQPIDGTTVVARRQSLPAAAPPPPPSTSVQPLTDAPSETSESDAEGVGPMPYNPATGKAMDPKEFGRALRPGEGSAMAAYIEAGQRIPRRGEIGLVGAEIEKYEKAGFVMSGSRHRRMNAVRIRKENQVISAEEKRGILKMQAEEKAKREGQIVASFRELVDTKLQQQDHGRR